MIKILHGKMEIRLKEFPDNYFDSVVTDSPYGLGEEPNVIEVLRDWLDHGYHEVKNNGGFMNAEWDKFVPQPNAWKEVYRVLKPGGHLVTFAGTRTYDWMVMSLRIAGFEIRDQLDWLYGCLSNDTEVLTEKGWISYKNLNTIDYDKIMCYDILDDSIHFERPQKWNEYQIKDTCYRIQSDSTDQIVTRNHRCLIERKGKLLFEFAEKAAREQQANIPILESMSCLRETFYDSYQRTSKQKQMLFKEMPDSNFNKPEKTCSKIFNREKMRCLWGKIQSKTRQGIKILFCNMQWKSTSIGLNKTFSQGSFELDKRNKVEIQEKNEGGFKSILERGRNISKQERCLPSMEDKIYKVSSRIRINEQERRVYNGVQIESGATTTTSINKNRGCSSYRSQSREQRYSESDVIQKQCRSQEIRSGVRYKTTLATITPFEYSGIVFCPTVSTGAFVARRNGMIFITGNSGFPKSLNVSKAIDAKFGAEREVIGKRKHPTLKNPEKIMESKSAVHTLADTWQREWPITAAATDEAKKWQGWGTALKPGHEPICLARKPLSEKNIAENILKWGTGAINIDESRIGFADDEDKDSAVWGRGTDIGGGNFVGSTKSSGKTNVEPNKAGRWPANVILSHHQNCVDEIQEWKCVDDCPIKILNDQAPSTGAVSMIKKGSYGVSQNTYNDYAYKGDDGRTFRGDITGASRFFYCAKADTQERNMGLDKDKYKKIINHGIHDTCEICGGRIFQAQGFPGTCICDEPTRQGKIVKGNFHPTVKPVALMQWLVNLITPINGKVLDPFNGTGSTGIACKIDDFEYIGIEQEKVFCDISVDRINGWIYQKKNLVGDMFD